MVECDGSSSCVTLLPRVEQSVAESAIDLSSPDSVEHSRSRSGIVAVWACVCVCGHVWVCVCVWGEV